MFSVADTLLPDSPGGGRLIGYQFQTAKHANDKPLNESLEA
jgi:hypothetical protein